MTQGSFELTPRQQEANRLLGGEATHVLLRGGARSGKTFLIIRAIVTRALAYESRHAVLRFRFNHLKGSVIYDTLPKVMKLCFPEVEGHLDKSDWFFSLPSSGGGRSEIWFGGLDDKERTEKILGQEYSSILLNECSQIPLASRHMAITRLAQNTPLRLRAFYDCNPPAKGHWTYRLFTEKKDPDRLSPLPKDLAANYAEFRINPEDNKQNLPPGFLAELQSLPERQRRRFYEGEYGEVTDGALWTLESLDAGRLMDGELPEMKVVVVSVDPSGASGPEDKRSDEIGISVCGLGADGKGYVLEDLSGRYSPGGEQGWGKIAADAWERWSASRVVAETNFGGAMVREVIRAANPLIPFREVKASRGKIARAEPISYLFEQNKAVLAGRFPKLEDQLCAMTAAGYAGDRSPDRADAMVWGLTDLFPQLTRKTSTAAESIAALDAALAQNTPRGNLAWMQR
jgi:phage terminase large subunit-like protein